MDPVIGVLTLQFRIPHSMTLKDKRSVVKSLIQRLSNTFNVSVAETGHLDSVRRAGISVAYIANDKSHVHRVLSKVQQMAEREPDAVLEDINTEVW
ncbi:MAG: DUF503 domain-containing protein [Armatimonadota bacterium]